VEGLDSFRNVEIVGIRDVDLLSFGAIKLTLLLKKFLFVVVSKHWLYFSCLLTTGGFFWRCLNSDALLIHKGLETSWLAEDLVFWLLHILILERRRGI
jgi:hypothetical protein